jgi:hypothetical protein
MEPGTHVEAFEYAARKNIAAVELAEQGKLREALNALNQAVAAAPSYHLTYANRAVVFERMGLLPQAEADRRKAAELSAADADTNGPETFEPDPEVFDLEREVFEPEPQGVEPGPEVFESEPEGVEPKREIFEAEPEGFEPDSEVFEPRASPPLQAAPPATPRPPRSLPSMTFPTSLVIPVAFFVLLLAVTAGTLIGALAILRSDDTELTPGPGSAIETPGGGNPQTDSPSFTPVPGAVATGSPFSSSSLEIAWRGRSIAASLGSASQGFSGFNISPVDMSLGGDGSAQLSVFFYGSREAPQQDWDLVAGSRPAPKAGRVLPTHVSIWWNANVIIVVRSASGALSAAALDAFLSLGG